MRKNIFLIIAVFVGLLCCADVQAAELELLRDSPDYKGVLNCEDALLENILLSVNGSSPEIPMDAFSEEDIHLGDAVVEYLDTPLFEKQCINRQEADELFEQSTYWWILPLRYDGYLLEVCIEQEVNEEGVKSEEWTCGAVYGWDQGRQTTQETLNQCIAANGLENAGYTYKFVGGLMNIQEPVFIAMDDEQIQKIIPAKASSAELFQADENQISAYSMNAGGYPAYEYADVMKVNKEPVNNMGSGAAGIDLRPLNEEKGRIWIYIGAAGVVIAMIICCGVFMKKKKNNDGMHL
ncbi:MAG: hypothetical protein PHS82_09725 [Lachnospiraceae bacterium]|nr:hypothetical protein [Lachnospiraceae bacterium]